VDTRNGAQVLYHQIRMRHDTREIESRDTPEQTHVRTMGYYWPWLGGGL